jgi:caffeoyl-CoA O-methyltransferase
MLDEEIETMPDDAGEQIDSYIQTLFIQEDAGLRGALDSARAEGLPAIQVPAALGKLLGILTRASGARKILEIGTLGGYSGIWLARALPAGGRLISLDVNAHHADVARRSFERAGVADRVEVRVGPALESLPTLQSEAPFDLIYIDADKENYPGYLDWALRLARPGTLIIGDNVLRGGAIIRPAAGDAGGTGINEFNRRAAEHPKLDAIILPNRNGRDGVLIATVKM